MPADDRDLLPLHEEAEPTGFDVVLRGYDRNQVNDYLDRVEAMVAETDARHAEDTRRFQEYERQLGELRAHLDAALARAEGRPEPASLVGERLTRMLALAEQEAAAIEGGARAEADRVIDAARQAAEQEHAQRAAVLAQREREIEGASAAAEQTRLEAQHDADSIRASARREADEVVRDAQQHAADVVQHAQQQAQQQRQHADEDARRTYDEARAQAAYMVEQADRQVQELAAQRDHIARQLESLRDAVSAAVSPLSSGGSVQLGDERAR